MSYWYNVLRVQGIFCRYSPNLWCCCSSIFIVNYDISNVDYYSKSYSYQVYLWKNWWNIGKHSKVTTSASLAGSVLLYKYFVMIPFFVWKYMKCQLFFIIKLWLVQLTAIQLFCISSLTSQCYKNIFFKSRGFKRLFVFSHAAFNDFQSWKILWWTAGN